MARIVYIGSARISETNDINGIPGDQTLQECAIEKFYMHKLGWVCYRAKDKKIRSKMASLMAFACGNDHIGYGQKDRSKIWYVGTGTSVDVNADCSSLGAEVIREAGIPVENFTTVTAHEKLKKTGKFEEPFTVTDSSQLEEGDFLVTKTKGHCCIVTKVDDSTPVASSNSNGNTTSSKLKVDHAKSHDKQYNSTYVTTGSLYLRTGAGKYKDPICIMAKGTKVRCYGYFTKVNGDIWLYVKLKDMTGFCSLKYLSKE